MGEQQTPRDRKQSQKYIKAQMCVVRKALTVQRTPQTPERKKDEREIHQGWPDCDRPRGPTLATLLPSASLYFPVSTHYFSFLISVFRKKKNSGQGPISQPSVGPAPTSSSLTAPGRTGDRQPRPPARASPSLAGPADAASSRQMGPSPQHLVSQLAAHRPLPFTSCFGY